MSKSTRRLFLQSGATAGLAVAAGCQTSPSGERAAQTVSHHPDLILIKGQVYTVDDNQPQAEAFAVKNGRFVAVGSESDIAHLAGPGTEVIDAAGMTVTPGFIDTHCHPSGVRELTGVNVNLRSIVEIQEVLRRKAADTEPGYWVSGYMYDDTRLNEGRPVSRRDLDEAVPDHPAMVGHRGGHTGVYNSKAFELAGVTARTPDPRGGKFYRENGELAGKVAERVRSVFNGVGKREEVTRETRRAGVKFISQEMTKAGITSVHQTGGSQSALTALQDAYTAGELRFRMYFFPSGGGSLFRALLQAGVRTGFGNEWLRI